ncbi:MAG: hypothetical protein EXS48_01445 [Candidatus Staskawiczbacteria bacterium]|nr:hypothetical protein [Candidatus Staskawiczbacteria bacterium]
MKDIERLAGLLMTIGVLWLIILSPNVSWWIIVPTAILLTGIIFMWRVKLSQKAIARLMQMQKNKR